MPEWWEDKPVGQKVAIGFILGIIIVGIAAAVGLVTKLLWNWLMPEIFGLPSITYWQSVGLLLLSCIFFKNIGNDSSGKRSDRRRKRRLRHYMSEEQKPENESPPEDQPGPGEPSPEGV